MKDPLKIENAEILIQPDAGTQELPALVIKFANGRSVLIDLSLSKYRRLRTVNHAARKHIATLEAVANSVDSEKEETQCD